MNRFPHQCRSCSSISKSVGCLWVYHAWNYTSSWFPYLSWCLSILLMCQGAPFLPWQITLWLRHIGWCRCMRSWISLTVFKNQCSVRSWSIGLSSWTWGAAETLLPGWKIFSLLCHNLLWGGAPNLILSCLSTYFHSLIPPWLVWLMDIMIWCSWIKLVLGLDLCMEQSELLL